LAWGRLQNFGRFFVPKVEDAMSKPVVTIGEDATILEAVNLMNDRRIGSLVVIVDGKPAGIFTRSDLMRRVLERGVSLTETKVGDVMSSPIVTVRPNDKVDSAVEVMRENKVTRAVVLDDSRLVGILTQTDIRLRLSISQLSYKHAMKRYIVDTFAYIVFWSGITVIIQLFIVGITLEKFVASSLLGLVATILLAGIYGRFLDMIRNKFKV